MTSSCLCRNCAYCLIDRYTLKRALKQQIVRKKRSMNARPTFSFLCNAGSQPGECATHCLVVLPISFYLVKIISHRHAQRLTSQVSVALSKLTAEINHPITDPQTRPHVKLRPRANGPVSEPSWKRICQFQSGPRRLSPGLSC